MPAVRLERATEASSKNRSRRTLGRAAQNEPPPNAPWDAPWDETTPDSAVPSGPERTQRTPTSTRPNRAKGPASQPHRRSQVDGGGGIRTRGPRERTPVFKTGAFDRSATPPGVSVREGSDQAARRGGPTRRSLPAALAASR